MKKVLIKKKNTDSFIGKQLQDFLIPKPKPSIVNRAIIYFPIDFTGKNSISLKNKIMKLLKEFYPQILIRVIFKRQKTMQRYFQVLGYCAFRITI